MLVSSVRHVCSRRYLTLLVGISVVVLLALALLLELYWSLVGGTGWFMSESRLPPTNVQDEVLRRNLFGALLPTRACRTDPDDRPVG